MGLQENKAESELAAGNATSEQRETSYPFLEQHRPTALGNVVFTLKNLDRQKGEYLEWIEGERDKRTDKIDGLKSNMICLMTDYNRNYHEETREIVPDVKSLSEYVGMLEKDGLPEFEIRFKKLLHENTINQN